MIDSDTYLNYDKLMSDVINTIINQSKENKEIIFMGFTPQVEWDLCILQGIKIVHDLFNFPIKVNCSFIDYLSLKKTKIFNKRKLKWISKSKIKKIPNDKIININQVCITVAHAHGELTTYFKDIYDAYYKPKKEEK